MSFHAIYSFILSKLALTDDHRDNLLARGISEVDILRNGYKSWPYKRRDLVAACVHRFGKESLIGIPGFWQDDSGQMQLSGVSGIAIPILDLSGKVEGIKLRPDKPANPASKYVHLSSNPAPDKRTHEVKYPNGTAAKIACHFPPRGESFASLELKDIRITEGELKAEVATILSGTYTISVPGVGLWESAIPHLEKLKPGRVIIAYDADKNKSINSYSDKPFEVAVHLAEFYQSLKAQGYNVVIEDWPESSGKGIDDVLADSKYDTVRFLTDAEADEFCKKAGADSGSVEADWVYIIGVERFVNTKTNQELKKDQYRDKFISKSKKKDPVDKALKSASFQRLDYPAYEPNKERLLTNDNGTTAYNYWRGSGVEPEYGEVQPFLDHVAYLLPNPEDARHLLDWLAWNIQRPGEKVHWAILLQGVQGTGKSFIGELMKMLLGEHNVSCPSNDELHEPYTGWQKNCQLIVIEELMARGRLELMNKFKPMITQPMCRIREMYKPQYDLRNCFNILMLTNYKDAIIIDDEDRRYCVLFSPATPRDKSYYDALWEWMEANLGKLLHYFRNYDLSSFHAKGHAPKTAAKAEVVKASATPVQAWVQDGIESEGWPFMTDVLTTKHLLECAPPYLRGINPNNLGRALTSAGARQLAQIRLESGERVRPWSLRRHEMWAEAKEETVAAEIEKWSASKEPGGNPLMDAKPI